VRVSTLESIGEGMKGEKHLPLAAKMEGVDRLELTLFGIGPNVSKPASYRMAELYFPTERQMQASLDSPEGQAIADDLQKFSTGGVTMLVGSVES
jgi:uncharacterized protein (TIGR02118 family)